MRNKWGAADLWIKQVSEYFLENGKNVVSIPYEYLVVHKR